jgi:hypothetical protein
MRTSSWPLLEGVVRSVRVKEWVRQLVFDAPIWKLVTALLIVSVVKTGIWWIPNLPESRSIADDPFRNPFVKVSARYLYSSWLAPFLAWLVGANGNASFFLFHFAFAIAFSALFCWLTLTRQSDRNARVSLAIFAMLPVSGVAYFWIGSDGVTLFLMLLAFVLPSNPLWGLLVGVLLGMQHFEQSSAAAAGTCGALVLNSWNNRHATVSVDRSMPTLLWCVLLFVGVIAGKLFLDYLFTQWGAEVLINRTDLALQRLPVNAKRFVLSFHVTLWSVLGLGWIVMVKYLERGRDSLPFVLVFCGLLLLLVGVEDQTRVLAIVTFPLVFAFWLQDSATLSSINEEMLSWLVMIWVVVPWSWVWSGRSVSSVFPYDLVLGFYMLTGLAELTPNISYWPFPQ